MIKKLMFVAPFLLIAAVGPVQAGGDVAKGKELAVDCADCHGEDGKGDADTPALVGHEQAYFIEQLKAFKSGARKDDDDTMKMYTEDLSEQDMADLAAYYASLPVE